MTDVIAATTFQERIGNFIYHAESTDKGVEVVGYVDILFNGTFVRFRVDEIPSIMERLHEVGVRLSQGRRYSPEVIKAVAKGGIPENEIARLLNADPEWVFRALHDLPLPPVGDFEQLDDDLPF